MAELIWVGNTIYPRWFVIAVPTALALAPFLLIGVVRLAWHIAHRLENGD